MLNQQAVVGASVEAAAAFLEAGCGTASRRTNADSEIVMVDLGFGDDSFEQDRSWDDFGTTISGI